MPITITLLNFFNMAPEHRPSQKGKALFSNVFQRPAREIPSEEGQLAQQPQLASNDFSVDGDISRDLQQ